MNPAVLTLIGTLRLWAALREHRKAGAACVLGVVEAIVGSGEPFAGKLLVTGTTDEEYWSRGAHALAGSGLIDHCLFNIVPEPAPHAIIYVGERGRHVFKLVFLGESISAAYDAGNNAAVAAAKAVVRIGQYIAQPRMHARSHAAGR